MKKTMKKEFLSLALAVLTCVSCTADDKLHVKMNVKEMGDSVVVMSVDDRNFQQSFVGKQGVFGFDVDVAQPMLIYLAEPQLLRGKPGRLFQIPAVPGETVELTSESKERYDVNGSTFYAQYHEADLVIEEAEKPLKAFSADIQAKFEAGISRDSLMKVYQEQSPALLQSVDDAIITFIKAHPDWEASAAIIRQLQSVDQMKNAAQLLTASVRDGRCKPLYQNVIDQREAQERAEQAAAQKQASGVEAPDFELNDINGKPLKLSSLRGKYVVLDFWGSWCSWCIKGIPDMKAYYQKYAGKFEILSVDCNDTEAKWKAAVEKYELPWLHVYNPSDSKVLEQYGIQGFPTKIIIGPDGKIVKTIVGEDPAFYTLLDELFKKDTL